MPRVGNVTGPHGRHGGGYLMQCRLIILVATYPTTCAALQNSHPFTPAVADATYRRERATHLRRRKSLGVMMGATPRFTHNSCLFPKLTSVLTSCLA